MSGINADVREIVQELDVDGSGYQTREAANLLIHRYVLAGICNSEGDPKPKVRALMRLGAGVAFKNYKGDGAANDKRRERAAAAASGEQGDFYQLSEDFDFQWLMDYAAWDESEEAERKVLVRMTLPEILEVIAFKRRKATEAMSVANMLQNIVDAHPDWYEHPALTVADILDIHEWIAA